ncbi:hypothetical protein RI367_008463 [Sorochytrium milnesiophthora]
MQPTTLLLFLLFVVLMSGLCDGAKDFQATGCVVSLNFMEPPQPKPLPARTPSQVKTTARSFMSLASIALGLVPVAGSYVAAVISASNVIMGLCDGPPQPPAVVVNEMSSSLLQWTKETVAHELTQVAVKGIKTELAVLAEGFKRVEQFGRTKDGYDELTALHRRYLDDWQTFFPDVTKPQESMYEHILGHIQTYCSTYVAVAGVQIDYRKEKVEDECSLQFPSHLRLLPTQLNATKLAKRGSGDAGARCQHARTDLASTYQLVSQHLERLHRLLEHGVVQSLRAKYNGEPFLREDTYQAMEKGVLKYNGLSGEYTHAHQGTAVNMRWESPSKWSPTHPRLNVQCEHRLAAASTCKIERSDYQAPVLEKLDPRWPIYNGGSECLSRLDAFTRQYREGPMQQVRQFIQNAVVPYNTALRKASSTIAGDRLATEAWFHERSKPDILRDLKSSDAAQVI